MTVPTSARTTMRRREVLRLGLRGGAALVASAGIFTLIRSGGSALADTHFQMPLPIPTVLAPVRSDAGADYYQMTQREVRKEILPGLQTTIWGYEGQFPPPTIRVRSGRTAILQLANRLPVPTVLHLHGGVTPPDSDGFPMDLAPPGGTARHVFPNNHRAATLWYHDHAMDHTGHNNFMGLGDGLYIIEDDAEANLPLPRDAYDVSLVIQGRKFAPDGSFVFSDSAQFGTGSDVTLVNGAPWPHMEVARRKYRFRILNAANDAIYQLALGSGRPLVQIATEGGLLPALVQSDSIVLSMAERVEVVVDFADYPLGTQIVLQNRWSEGTGDIMRFDVVRDAKDDSMVPDTLGVVEPLAEDQAVRTRTFDIGPILNASFPPITFSINGKSFDPDRVDEMPRLDDVEIWRFRTGGVIRHHHPMHIHLVNFQILDRNGAPPVPYETGWKDTVRVGPHDDVRVIARFAGFRGKYVLHCHNLAHEDHAMMARFE